MAQPGQLRPCIKIKISKSIYMTTTLPPTRSLPFLSGKTSGTEVQQIAWGTGRGRMDRYILLNWAHFEATHPGPRRY